MPDMFVDPFDIKAAPVTALLDASLVRFPARPAMEFAGRRWTYAELGELVARAVRGLQNRGVGPGTKVGLCLPNTPYSVIFYYAALRAGATVVNFNPLYVERELRFQIEDSGTTVMVTADLPMIYDKVRAVSEPLSTVVVCPIAGVLPAAKGVLYRLLKRGMIARPARDARTISCARLMADPAPPEPVAVEPSSVAVLQYTGGTTGTPKGAMLTHANLFANAHQVNAHVPSLRQGQERMLVVLPLFHVFAMTSIMNAGIALGAELMLQPRFEIEALMKVIERGRPTLFHAVPTIYGAINAACDKAKRDVSSLRICVSGGAPLPGEVRARFEAHSGCKLVEGYGLSEASPTVCCNPADGLIKDGTVGTPMAGTVIEIRDPADPSRVLPRGERGEVCVRGPQVMAGYWNRPEETAAVFVDGALRTGDIGVLDEDGYLSIVDRIKDVILCGGYNVYPRVLEEALYQHPAVADAIVIGVPDSYRGQAPKAFVTLREGRSATTDELRAHLSGHVSKIELPREIEIRDELPRTMVGKLSKKELVEEEAEKASA